MPSPRRFPAPWSAELQPNYYAVRDADGQQIAYINYSNDPDRRSAAKLFAMRADRDFRWPKLENYRTLTQG